MFYCVVLGAVAVPLAVQSYVVKPRTLHAVKPFGTESLIGLPTCLYLPAGTILETWVHEAAQFGLSLPGIYQDPPKEDAVLYQVLYLQFHTDHQALIMVHLAPKSFW